ncbi:MAG: hypothetical protein IT427_15110 [Pirellulales bacterium]|nr:hypothetical protein [Pirellulales bacterium]
MNFTTYSVNMPTGLVPILCPPREPVNEERAALEIALLRRRQLRRADVREKLAEYAKRRGGGNDR